MKTIAASDISEITAFQIDVRPVCKIKFRDGTSLVLRAEYYSGRKSSTVADRSVFSACKMMKQVRPALGVELVNAPKMSALQAEKPSVFNPFDVRRYLFGFMKGKMLYKMPFLDEVRDARNMVEQSKAAELLSKLKNSSTMEALDKIVAIELFNGKVFNGTRDGFSLEGYLAHTSNLLFAKNLSEPYTPVGPDFYAAVTRAASLIDDPPRSHSANDSGLGERDWGGPILTSGGTRFTFATKCIDSLNLMFRSELSKLGPVPPASLLMTADALNFSAGLAAGAKALRSHLAKKAAKGQLPQCVLTRMELLTWTSGAPGPARPQAPTPNTPGFTSRGVFFEAR